MSDRRRPGRPRILREPALLKLYVEQERKDALQQQAATQKVSVAELLRRVIDDALPTC